MEIYDRKLKSFYDTERGQYFQYTNIYECTECHKEFEKLRKGHSSPVHCPKCNGVVHWKGMITELIQVDKVFNKSIEETELCQLEKLNS